MMIDHAQALVEAIDLSVAFDEKIIHQHLNLSIQPGEIVALIGASGCGKTTLMRALLGLQPIVAGSIKLFGVDMTTATAEAVQTVRERTGVLFQQSALFSSQTILENLTFPLKNFTKLNDSEMCELAFVKLALVGLAPEVAYQYPATLSGGMLKRAALARALMLDPELLFLDEPTAGLDPKSAAKFDKLVLRLQESLHLTIVMVSHDLASLRSITDKVAFIAEQRIIACLPYGEMMQQTTPVIKEYFET